MRKLSIRLFAAVLAVSTFGMSVYAKSSVSTKNKVTLRFGWWGGDDRHKAYLDAIKKYMELNPDVTIVAEYGGWNGYKEKLYTQLAGGNAPQIFQNHYTWLQEESAWADATIVKDLYKYKSLIDFSIYPDKFLDDNVVIDKKLLALPSAMNANVLVANKALLDKIQFKYDQPVTFDDFFKYSSQLKKINQKYYFENGMDAADIHMYWFIAYLEQKTGLPFATNYKLNYDKATLTDAFTFLKRYFDEKVVEPLGTLELYAGNYPQNPKWINGESAVLFGMLSTLENYVHAMGTYAKDATVIPLPVMKNAKNPYYQTKVGQIFSISGSASEKETVEAVKFLNWMNTDKEAGVLLKLSRGIPVSKVQNEALAQAGLISPLIVKAQELSKKAGQGMGEGLLVRNNEISTIGADIVSKVAFGLYTPDQAAGRYIEQMNKKLAELKDKQ